MAKIAPRTQPSPKTMAEKLIESKIACNCSPKRGVAWQGEEVGGGYARLEEVKLVFYGRASLIWSWSLAWMARRLGSVPFGHLLQLQHSAASGGEEEGERGACSSKVQVEICWQNAIDLLIP